MRNLLSLIFLVMLSVSAAAVGVDEKRLDDPTQEARAQEIMKQIRCLVCQNQSIVDSDAALARDLRIIVRERIIAGDNDEQILGYMTSRYGDWVLLKPPFDGATIVLWLSPLLLLMVGFYVIYRNQKLRKSNVSSEPLTSEEKQRLEQLLNNEGRK